MTHPSIRAADSSEVIANHDDDHPRQIVRDIVIRYFKQDLATLL